jgi:hypothetical protein
VEEVTQIDVVVDVVVAIDDGTVVELVAVVDDSAVTDNA